MQNFFPLCLVEFFLVWQEFFWQDHFFVFHMAKLMSENMVKFYVIFIINFIDEEQQPRKKLKETKENTEVQKNNKRKTKRRIQKIRTYFVEKL